MSNPPSSHPVARSGFVPLAVHEAHADEVVTAYFAATSPGAFDRLRGERAEDAPWGSYRVDAGVALIPVLGSLIPRGLYLGSGYATPYEALCAELRRAGEDPAVERVALMIDSPGGYVSNLDAAAAAVGRLRQAKPVKAYVQGMACSAAYWLASACEEIVCSPQAELGSIGVVQAHFDMSKMLDSFGLAVTLLHAGAKKVDGNPYEPLSDRVKAEMTQRLEDLRMAFAEAVAAGRPSLDVAAVLATEAATFVGAEAVKRGLADRVGFLADDLPDSDNPLVTSPLGRFMEKSMFTQAQLDVAVAAAVGPARATALAEGKAAGAEEGRKAGHEAGRAEGFAAGRTEGHAAGKAEGAKEGAVAERERIKGIRSCDAAKTRPKAAEHVALTTDMSVESAGAFLAGLQEEGATSSLSSEMTTDEAARRAASVRGGDAGTKLEDLKGEAKGAAIAGLLGLAKKKKD